MRPMHCPDQTNDACKQAGLLIGQRAADLFLTRQLWCSGAALVVLNQALGGGLTRELAIRLASGLGDGMGGSGCLCGALNGSALALGLFLGTGRLAPGGDKLVLKTTRQLHDKFQRAFGSACCRVLMKNDRHNARSRNQACARRTAKAAEITAALILCHQPELIQQVDWNYLNENGGLIGARIEAAADRLLN